MTRVTTVLGLLLMSGCATGGSVRQLGPLEMEVIHAVDKAVTDHGPMLEAAARSLGELGAEYAKKEFELELSVAKAKRLESMQAPWASPTSDLASTQRAVVLYHLYEVEMAEQRVLDARMAERRAAAQQIIAHYGRLSPLLRESAQNMETLLQYLNQPKGAHIAAFAQAFLGEVTAFRSTLQASDNLELQRLAADVARYEASAGRAKEQAASALDAILRLGGSNDD